MLSDALHLERKGGRCAHQPHVQVSTLLGILGKKPDTSTFFEEAVSERSHKVAWTGCMVSLTTPTRSPLKVSTVARGASTLADTYAPHDILREPSHTLALDHGSLTTRKRYTRDPQCKLPRAPGRSLAAALSNAYREHQRRIDMSQHEDSTRTSTDSAASRARLPSTLRLGAVHLTVSDLDRPVAFYEDAIGLRLHRQEGGWRLWGRARRTYSSSTSSPRRGAPGATRASTTTLCCSPRARGAAYGDEDPYPRRL
jgi:hypothetical protein